MNSSLSEFLEAFVSMSTISMRRKGFTMKNEKKLKITVHQALSSDANKLKLHMRT